MPNVGQDRLQAMLAHACWVRALALQLCADVHGAEDAAQTTLLAALQQPPREPHKAKSFLARTLRNVLHMQRRQEQRRRRREHDAAAAAAEAAVDAGELAARNELYRLLLDAVAALPAAPRELVLRHYLEGESIADLARRSRQSADAVRAHLRRARARLRGELERRGGEVWRAFAVLPAAGPLLLPAGSMTAVALAAGVSMVKTKLVLAAAVAAAAILCFVPSGSPPPDGQPRPAAVAPAVTASGDHAPAKPELQRRQLAAAEPLAIRGRLIGLHPALPWTTSMTLCVEAAAAVASFETGLEIASDGSFATELPAWTRDCDSLRLRLSAADAWYRAVDVTLVFDAATPLQVHVEPVEALVGDVVDAASNGVAGARILVFAADAGVPRASVAGQSVSDAQGRYRVRVDAAADFFVVAMPAAGAADVQASPLPAGVAATMPGPVREVATIVMPAASFIQGTVQWSDGSPVADAAVRLRIASSVVLDRKLGLGWMQDGTVVQECLATTSTTGHFTAPAPAGTAGSVLCERVGKMLPARFAAIAVVAPQQVTIQLDGHPVRLRALLDGQPAARAGIEWHSHGFTMLYATGDDGELQQLVLDEPLEVRAFTADRSQTSEWAKFEHGPPPVVELQLLPAAGEPVTVQVQTAMPASTWSFLWHNRDADGKAQSFTLRGDGSGYRMRVPPGNYRLRLLPIEGSPTQFVLPCERDVAVPAAEPIVLTPQFGGRLRLSITNAAGHFVAGSCRLVDAAAHETAPPFVADARGGSLPVGRFGADAPATSAVALAAGSYEVALDLGAHGVLRRKVDIESGEVAELRIRLP